MKTWVHIHFSSSLLPWKKRLAKKVLVTVPSFLWKRKKPMAYLKQKCAHLFGLRYRWAQPPWKRWGTLYENDSICVTISCSRILKTNSLLKTGKTGRWRRQGINILELKDSPLNFLQSHHKLFLFKLKSQILKIGRFYATYRDSDFSRGTNW